MFKHPIFLDMLLRSTQFAVQINYFPSHMSIHISKSIVNILEFMMRAPRLIKSERHFPCLQQIFVLNLLSCVFVTTICCDFFFSSVMWHHINAFLCKGYVKYICHHIYQTHTFQANFSLSLLISLLLRLPNTTFSIKNSSFYVVLSDMKCLIFR